MSKSSATVANKNTKSSASHGKDHSSVAYEQLFFYGKDSDDFDCFGIGNHAVTRFLDCKDDKPDTFRRIFGGKKISAKNLSQKSLQAAHNQISAFAIEAELNFADCNGRFSDYFEDEYSYDLEPLLWVQRESSYSFITDKYYKNISGWEFCESFGRLTLEFEALQTLGSKAGNSEALRTEKIA
ncbi:hypothetical protein DASC09_029820 [Saccharomycopsis crataegensis]|uniref:Uncharacterized protein n=1 Tax=Saccharomycopsis crataegensis TaxID=43959 RepID=A0AAV5QM13_9ASCO|nr:hypothetical protein DASC09_029820 [Saccharomycopsis crataegensis]